MVLIMQPESSDSHLRLVSNAGSAPLPQQYYNTGSGGGGGMDRIERLEADVRGIKSILDGLQTILTRIDTTHAHLATKAEIARLPGRWELYAILVGFLAITQIPSILGALKDYNSQASSGIPHESQGSNRNQ